MDLGFGHTLWLPIRLSRDVGYVVGFMNLKSRREDLLGVPQGVVEKQIVFKARGLNEISKGVSRDRSKKRV